MKKRTMRWLVGSSLAAATGIVMLFWISSLLQTFHESQKEYRAASLPPELRTQLDSLKGNAHTIRETVGAAGGILRRLGTGGALPPESVAAIEAKLREATAAPMEKASPPLHPGPSDTVISPLQQQNTNRDVTGLAPQ